MKDCVRFIQNNIIILKIAIPRIEQLTAKMSKKRDFCHINKNDSVHSNNFEVARNLKRKLHKKCKRTSKIIRLIIK